ncbi:MAG: adenylate/guanylate cyclase domain-containing protein [Actinobacteria bacterium]|nr:adenylate/guanylate cyclase domain-containing protein [Actinomycetota bacterium]
MTLRDELAAYAAATHADSWTTVEGRRVPEADAVPQRNNAVKLDATVLYADLAESTQLVKTKKPWFAAEVYKNYLYSAGRIISSLDGVITSYDGDRVMGVFIGDSMNTNAARAALRINYAVTKILMPALQARYPDSTYQIKQRVGVDTSSRFIARTGVRGNNDLVWVGNAANNAAKMAALSKGCTSYISANVYGMLSKKAKYASGTDDDMWKDLGTSDLGYRIYGSTYWSSF